MSKHYLHICNPTAPKPTGCTNIASMAELEAIEDNSNSVYLIHIHLNWEGRKLSSNYGFDIANLIRTKIKSFAPIIFYSPIQQVFFEAKSEKEIKYKILFGRGSAFIESPFTGDKLKELAKPKPLNKAALHDVATMLCDLKGIVIDKLNHDLKFEANIDEIIGSVTPYLSVEQKRLIHLDSFVSEIKEKVKANDPDGFLNEKLQFIMLCNQALTEAGKNTKEQKKTKHKVLVVDDLQEELNKVKTYLGEDYTIETATTGEEAIDILKQDVKNEIVAVICDWRLFTDEKQNYWQPLQGYEVLDFAAKHGIRSLFALTSQADFVVHHLRNLMGIRFSLFKKENLNTADQWKVFADVLFEACEQAVVLRASLPDNSAQWTNVLLKNSAPLKTLKQQYIEVWNSEERDSYFSKITTTANEIWEYLKATPMNNTLTTEFGITVPTKVLELEPILIYRRIWLALWFDKTDIGRRISKEIISEYSEKIYKRMFAPGIRKEMPNSGTQNTYKLCIEINKVQQGKFLPEEKDWLIKQGLIQIG